GVRGYRGLPADAVHPGDLVRLAVPGVAAFEEPPRHAHHHGRREAIAGAPAQRPAVVQLLGRAVRVLTELDFRHRQQSRERHAHRAADDAFLGEAGIEYPRRAVLVLQPESRPMHAALGADILAEDQHARIERELYVEGAPD